MLTNKSNGHQKRKLPDLAAGDPVVVIAGKDRGKHGEVLRTIPEKGTIVVKGVNIAKRHAKSGQRAGGNTAIQGGVIDFEAPLSYSNVMLVCPSCNKPTRIRHRVMDDGKKAIECTHCGELYERVRKVEQA